MAHEARGDRHFGESALVDVVHAVETLIGVERDGLGERYGSAVDVERRVGQFDGGTDRTVVQRPGRGVVVSHHPELTAHERQRSPRTERHAHLVAVHAVAEIVVVFAAGVPLVDHQLFGALHPYVDARGDELFGRGLQRRAVEAVGHLVVLPRIVVVTFGNRAAERFGRVVLAHARDDFKAFGLHRVGVGLEDQRLGLRRAAEKHLRRDLLVVVVQDDDVFRGCALERSHFGPGDFDGLVIAFDLGRVGDIDLQGRGAGGRQGGCNPKNHVFHTVCLKIFCCILGKFTIFPYIGQPNWQIIYFIWQFFVSGVAESS